MSYTNLTGGNPGPVPDHKSRRSVRNAMLNGLKSKCPSCAKGEIYDGFLRVKNNCGSCGEELFHHRADDLPPYLNIMLVGKLVLTAVLISMNYELFGMWTTAIGGSLLAILLSVVLMRPLKGMVIGNQWALEMHGFGGEENQ